MSKPDMGVACTDDRSWPILLKNSVSGSNEKFSASMTCFILSDMGGIGNNLIDDRELHVGLHKRI